MNDFSWLAQEAQAVHLIFENLFFIALSFLLVVAVCLEYMKFSVGELPQFSQLVGRCFVAAIMLISFPEFLHIVGDITDGLVAQIGELKEFDLVVSRMSEQLDKLTWSWTSAKQMAIVTVSFLTFFVLYISVYVSEAIYFYSWTLLYVFSPLCFALYVLPKTSGAATGIFSSIIMVASWKVIWAVLATLLWSAALIDLEKLGDEVDFLTLILFNLMLAGSLLFAPLISQMLFKGGFAKAAAKVGGAATGAALYGASKIASPYLAKASAASKALPSKGFEAASDKLKMMKDQRVIRENPSLKTTPKELPSYKAEADREKKQFDRMDQAAIRKSPYKKYMPETLPSSIERRKRAKKSR